MTTEQRFWAKVNKTDGCWIWMASKRNKGYGAFGYTKDGATIQGRAHRYSWEIHNGEIPEGLCVLHNCPSGDNPACVNPSHLFLGTKAENNQDTINKGRYNHARHNSESKSRYERGASHHGAVLTDDIVRNIRSRRDAGESFGLLSKHFGLSVGHVFRIVTRKAWKHVE